MKSYNTPTDVTSYLIESLAIDTVYLCAVRALLNSGGYGESSESFTLNTGLVHIEIPESPMLKVTTTSSIGVVIKYLL